MKKLSAAKLAETVVTLRKKQNMTQLQLAQSAGMNRSMLSRLESGEYIPSIGQLQSLASVLGFEPTDMFSEQPAKESEPVLDSMRIAVAGTGYVGLSLAILLSQHNQVTAVDILEDKVNKLNQYISPIQDEYIEQYLKEARDGTRRLNLTATTDGAAAYADADFVIIAAPTNYDPTMNFFDCSAVESVIELILSSTESRTNKPLIVIKSTVPVGFTASMRKRFRYEKIIFSPEFLRESKALYDNLYPSRIIVGCDENTRTEAELFAALLQQGEGGQHIGEEAYVVERQRGEYVAVDAGGLVDAVGRGGGGQSETVVQWQPDGFGNGRGVGLGQRHALQGALHGTHYALLSVGQCAVEVEEDIGVVHVGITQKG